MTKKAGILIILICMALDLGLPVFADSGAITFRAGNNYPSYKSYNGSYLSGVDTGLGSLSFNGVIDAVNTGKADALLENREAVNHYSIQENLKDIIKPELSSLYPVEAAYEISKNRPGPVGFVNERMAKLRESGTYEKLYQKYFINHSIFFEDKRKKNLILGISAALMLILISTIAIHRYIIFLRNRVIKATKELRQQTDFLNSIVDNANIMILVWGMDGSIIKFNKFSEIETGFTEEEVKGKKWYDVIIPAHIRDEMLDAFDNIKQGKMAVNHENPVLCKDGRSIDILWNNSLMLDSRGNPEVVVSTGVDITDRKKAEKKLRESYQLLEATHEELTATEEELKINYDELSKSQDALQISEERYRLAMEASDAVLWDYDVLTNKLFISTKGRHMIGYPEDEELNNEALIEMIHEDYKVKYLQYMRGFFAGMTRSSEFEFKLNARSGNCLWILSRGKGIYDSGGKLIRIAGSYMDVTERKKAEEEIHKLAYYDLLTGLPNRALFVDRLNMALAESKRNKKSGALLYLDLDNFKAINDTQGHDFGDELIKKIAEKLKSCIREYDTIARLGGDEFMVMQPRISGIDDLVRFTGRIMKTVQEPWVMNGREFYITCSIGITVYPGDGKDSATLIRNADTALYRAKELGRNGFQLYESSMNDRILEKLEMENFMRGALDRKEFVVFYQPQVDINTGSVVGIEALVRWQHPVKGMIPPIKFIPLAEETGLIIPIGEWVLRTACIQSIKWREAGINNLLMAVNLSAVQFQQKDIVEIISRVLKETGMSPEYLELEITESIAMQDLDHTVSVLNLLRMMGIKISLDDFGTGYSSLNYLKNLPINTLKIDKHFVQEITSNSNEEAIAKAVISMAHSMLLSVTAEGVETEEQLEFLREQRCDKVQGFLFSKPLPAGSIEDILRQEKLF